MASIVHEGECLVHIDPTLMVVLFIRCLFETAVSLTSDTLRESQNEVDRTRNKTGDDTIR